ncbi:MAG: winged helix-turn-helix domain-containing protein [Candidatus Pacearchaeota archaeon]|jgi:predicted transcriptional regulator
MVKRAKLDIIKDILNLIKDNPNIKPTPLLRKSKISSSRFKEYYNELINRDLIKEISNNDDKSVILTDKGYKFLEKYKVIIDFIDEFEL